jgi:surfeit locus 1 family protein
VSVLAVLPKIFNRRWWWTTLLVIAGVIVLIQLGFWQLDRLEQRRTFNRTVAERWRLEPFDVNTNEIPADLSEMEYRRVQASGELDYSNQIVLSNQTRNQAPGVILVTPLVLDDNRAILVARGWVPSNRSAPEYWAEYEEPDGQSVVGLIQESQLLPNGNAPTPPDAPQVEWYTLNIDAIQPQMPYELLPVFILQLPEEGRSLNQLPMRDEPLTLDEGSHLSYAIQWYMFALIFGVGYIFFIHSQELREQRIAGTLEHTPVPGMDDEMNGESDITTMSHREGHA